jgi:hypothetical protein
VSVHMVETIGKQRQKITNAVLTLDLILKPTNHNTLIERMSCHNNSKRHVHERACAPTCQPTTGADDRVLPMCCAHPQTCSQCLCMLALAVTLLLTRKKVCSVYKPNALHRQLTRAALGHVQDAEQDRHTTSTRNKGACLCRGRLCAPTNASSHTHCSTSIPQQTKHSFGALSTHPHTHTRTHTHTHTHTPSPTQEQGQANQRNSRAAT